jgi:predicted ATPase
VEADLALGRYSEVIAHLDIAIAEHPLRERLRELLMLALYRTGRQADALNVFRDTRSRLVDELGIEPSRGLQDLQGRILAEDPTLLDSQPEREAHGNLGAPLTTFVGRGPELDDLRELIGKERLITLNGIGGVGKSRLAIELGASVRDWFPDGVWIIQLAALSDEALIPQTVAAVLDIREQPDQQMLGTLLDFLKSRTSLLILDDCEHLIRGCAHFAETALSHAPCLKILATSRESLAITGEIQWRVPSLSLPNPHPGAPDDQMTSEAMELFRQRAREVNVGFDLSDDNGATVARICERLDGIPLAIELAAGLCKALSAKEISDRLVDRFSLLTGGSRTALPRQQTLIATMDWSYDLLPENERYILRQLSVFSGGFSLEGAEAVVGDHDGTLNVLNGIVNLVSKSMIVQDQTGTDTRFNFLQTVRQYAVQRLLESGESAEARNRHLDYFLHRAEEAEPHLHSANQENVVAGLELEHDNYRAALDWSLERTPDKSIRLTAALWYFWDVHGYLSEGRRWLKNALDDNSKPPDSSFAWSLIGAGSLARAQGEINEATAFLRRALSMYRDLDDQCGTAKALDELAALAYLRGDHPQGRALCEESRDLYESAGGLEGVASTLFSLGHWSATTGDFRQSERLLRQSLALCETLQFTQGRGAALASLARLYVFTGEYGNASAFAEQARIFSSRINDEWNMAFLDFVLGEISRHTGDLTLSEELHETSLVRFRRRGDIWGVARTLRALSSVKRQSGNNEQALALLRQSLRLCAKLGALWETAQGFEELGLIRMQADDMRTAIILIGAASALRSDIGTPLPPCEEGVHRDLIRRAAEAVGMQQVENWREAGRKCDGTQVVQMALPDFNEAIDASIRSQSA